MVGILQSRTRDQLRRVEWKLDTLLKRSGIDLAAGADPQVVELLKAGRKIEAIKVYREQTGAGLAEAKQYVEDLERRA
jgi:hypothetical protein